MSEVGPCNGARTFDFTVLEMLSHGKSLEGFQSEQ